MNDTLVEVLSTFTSNSPFLHFKYTSKNAIRRVFVRLMRAVHLSFSCANIETIFHKKKRPEPLFFIIMLNNTFRKNVT